MIDCQLRILMAQKNIKQNKVSADTGIRLETINKFYNNKAKHLPVDVIEKLCIYFHCDVGDLFKLSSDTKI